MVIKLLCKVYCRGVVIKIFCKVYCRGAVIKIVKLKINTTVLYRCCTCNCILSLCAKYFTCIIHAIHLMYTLLTSRCIIYHVIIFTNLQLIPDTGSLFFTFISHKLYFQNYINKRLPKYYCII